MPVTGRIAVGFDDQRYDAQTFWADGVTIIFDVRQPNGSAAVGRAVSFGAAADTVALCADGDAIVGKLLKVEPDGACTVQNKGNTTLPAGAGATCTPGRRQIGALGPATARGYIRDANPAAPAELARMGPHCWDNVDMANVVVDLGG
jgi:hypothetical protein